MVSEITEPIMDNYTQACWCLRENDGWKRNDSWEIDKPSFSLSVFFSLYLSLKRIVLHNI